MAWQTYWNSRQGCVGVFRRCFISISSSLLSDRWHVYHCGYYAQSAGNIRTSSQSSWSITDEGAGPPPCMLRTCLIRWLQSVLCSGRGLDVDFSRLNNMYLYDGASLFQLCRVSHLMKTFLKRILKNTKKHLKQIFSRRYLHCRLINESMIEVHGNVFKRPKKHTFN